VTDNPGGAAIIERLPPAEVDPRKRSRPLASFVAIGLVGAMLTGMVGIAPPLQAAPESPASPSRSGRLDHGADHLSFNQFVQKAVGDYALPGAVVVVIENNTPIVLQGYGVREAGKPEQVDEDTRFQIGSVSKLFTATALGALVDELAGKIDWDTPIIEYMPEFALKDAYATRHATLRDFLAHRSGLKAYAGDLFGRLNYSSAEILHRARHLEPGHSFRAKWAYSNLGIFIAQEAGARLAHSTGAELLSSRILSPLGMQRSGPRLAELFKDDNHATAHNIDGTIMPFENVDNLSGAGAIVSTGADLARWLQMLLAKGHFEGQQILKPTTVQEIFSASMVQGPGGPLYDPNDAAGLGCESYDFLGVRVVEKNGAVDGFRSIVTLVPERQVGIAVVANKQLTVFPEAIRAEFLERYLGPSGRDLQAQIRQEQAAWNALLTLPRSPQQPNPPGKNFSAYSGQYTSQVYGPASVIHDGQALRVEIGPNHYPGTLQHWSDNTFLLTFRDTDDAPGLITFVIGPSGDVVAFHGEEYRPPGFTGLMANYGHFAREGPK
jgi:CubicO group peptidase (beta-lactamase class C family)